MRIVRAVTRNSAAVSETVRNSREVFVGICFTPCRANSSWRRANSRTRTSRPASDFLRLADLWDAIGGLLLNGRPVMRLRAVVKEVKVMCFADGVGPGGKASERANKRDKPPLAITRRGHSLIEISICREGT